MKILFINCISNKQLPHPPYEGWPDCYVVVVFSANSYNILKKGSKQNHHVTVYDPKNFEPANKPIAEFDISKALKQNYKYLVNVRTLWVNPILYKMDDPSLPSVNKFVPCSIQSSKSYKQYIKNLNYENN